MRAAAAFEADQSAVIVGQGEVDVAAAAEGFGHFVEGLGLDQGAGGNARGGGLPGDFAHGEPVAVGGQEGDQVVLDLHPDAGQDGQGVVLAGRDDHLGNGLGERVARHGAADRGQRRQRRVFGFRHGGQVEAAAAAGQGDFVAVGFDVDRGGGQAAADVGEQASGHQDGAFGADVSRDFQPGRGLVVEARAG